MRCSEKELKPKLQLHVVRLQDGQAHHDYWISDGLYGGLNSIQRDFATVEALPLRMDGSAAAAEAPLLSSTLFGPTCDGEAVQSS